MQKVQSKLFKVAKFKAVVQVDKLSATETNLSTSCLSEKGNTHKSIYAFVFTHGYMSRCQLPLLVSLSEGKSYQQACPLNCV